MTSALFQCCKLVNCRRLLLLKAPKDRLNKISTRLLNEAEWLATLNFNPHAEEADKVKKETTTDSHNDESSEEKELGVLSNYDISQHTLQQLEREGIGHLFEVQYKTFDHIKDGRDAIVQARTGTGKTLAFVLPLLEKLNQHGGEESRQEGRTPRVLALAPTRELALQTEKEFNKFRARHVAVSCFYGGVSFQRQRDELASGIDVLVGTPGRIRDHVNKQNLDISTLEHVVLDEADRMLDMGFQKDIDDILNVAYHKDNKPQTLLFSATVPPWVKEAIKKYTDGEGEFEQFNFIGGPVQSAVKVVHKSVMSSRSRRHSLIGDLIQVNGGKKSRTIVFTPTIEETVELGSSLSSRLNVDCKTLHGNITQKQREVTLQGFRDGTFNCLVATSVAARGLDIPDVDLILQTSPPNNTEDYIHRSGRTGRVGKDGLSIILYGHKQGGDVRSVEKRAGIKFLPIDPPSAEEVLDAATKDVVKSLSEIKDVSRHFVSAAETLIRERGAEKALVSALAILSGRTEKEMEDKTFGNDFSDENDSHYSRGYKRNHSSDRGSNSNRGNFSNVSDGRGQRNNREFSRPSSNRSNDKSSFSDRNRGGVNNTSDRSNKFDRTPPRKTR